MFKLDESLLFTIKLIQPTPRANPERVVTIFENRSHTITAETVSIFRIVEKVRKSPCCAIKFFEAGAFRAGPKRSGAIFKNGRDRPGILIE